MSNVIRMTRPMQTRPHPKTHEIASQWIALAELRAREKFPDRQDLRLASLAGKYEGALITILHNVPGAAEFLARVEGIEF